MGNWIGAKGEIAVEKLRGLKLEERESLCDGGSEKGKKKKKQKKGEEDSRFSFPSLFCFLN